MKPYSCKNIIDILLLSREINPMKLVTSISIISHFIAFLNIASGHFFIIYMRGWMVILSTLPLKGQLTFIWKCYLLKWSAAYFAKIIWLTVKPVLSGHLKIDKTKHLMASGKLMKVKSIAEYSHWSILQYFWPALSNNRSWKPVFGLLFEWSLKTGSTVC